MTLGERIKKVRRLLDLTQQEFADRLGMKRNSIAQVEMGRNTSDQTIISICREFNVNETWLRTGEGEMFNAAPESLVDELALEYGLDSLDCRIILGYLHLSRPEREVIKNYVKSLMVDEESAQMDAHAIYEAEARAKAEEYYRELMQEREPPDGPSALPTFGGDLLA